MNPPLERVRAIKDSQRCLVLGLVGLIPLLGVPAAFIALYLHNRLQRAVGEDWNPAQAYASWGYALSLISLLIPVAILGIATLFAVCS